VASLPSLTPRAIAKITKRYRCRLDSLLSADRGIDAIVSELAQEGRLADTLILFTSDNGWMQGEHRIANGKVVPYEPSIRVPLIVRGPGFAEGATASAPAANIDYAPTILRATGVAATGHDPDGVPLQDVAAGLYPDRDFALESFLDTKRSFGFQGVRTPNYAYVEYADGERALYDLAADPYELDNRAGDPAATIEAWLHQRTADLDGCSGTSCVLTGDPPAPLP
jgi:N-acetylglucosamine-6-sulfatase